MLRETGLTWWSFADVEERLIEAAELWMRTPYDGGLPGMGGPFATDAPWHLLTRAARAGSKMDAWRLEQDDLARKEAAPERRALGLDRAEVGRRDEATAWLLLVPEDDRRIVCLAVVQQARSGKRVDWGRMLREMGLARGKEGLRKRYSRAITALAQLLTRQRVKLAA
jgi:hypothetical protein